MKGFLLSLMLIFFILYLAGSKYAFNDEKTRRDFEWLLKYTKEGK